MGSHHKKKKGTDDSRIIIADIKKDAEADAIRTVLQTGLEMITGGGPNVPPARATIDFVNVTETIDPSQSAGGAGDSIPPAQVTGLSAVGVSGTQINLSWTANSEPDMNHYDVYRGTVSGFTVTLGVTVPVGQPATNSYSDGGRTPLTTYYYKVGAVDNSSNLGPVSVQASATTLAGGGLQPSLELRLENNFTDTSSNGLTVLLFDSNTNGFAAGQFGTAWQSNYPFTPTQKDALLIFDTAAIQMDTTTGFSISCWVNPQDLTAGPSFRRVIAGKVDDASNMWILEIDSAGILYFCVKKAGVDYKREISGFTLGTWQHVAATFNGATNTVAVYRNAVAGSASVATPLYPSSSNNAFWFCVLWDQKDSTYFEGILDEFRYYKGTVLTPTQVTNLKNTNAP